MKKQKSLTIIKSGAIPRLFELLETGLLVKGKPTIDEYRDLFIKINKLENAVQWWLGDLALAYNSHYGNVKKLAENLGINYGTLRNCISIASKYELSLRHDNLSYEHHRIAAPWEDRQEWLGMAEQNGWSVEEMKAARKHMIRTYTLLKNFRAAASTLFNIGDTLIERLKTARPRATIKKDLIETAQQLIDEAEGMKFEIEINDYRYTSEPLTRVDFQPDDDDD